MIRTLSKQPAWMGKLTLIAQVKGSQNFHPVYFLRDAHTGDKEQDHDEKKESYSHPDTPFKKRRKWESGKQQQQQRK